MAQPITFHPNTQDSRRGAADLLQNAPREHAEALLSALAILQSLHDEGVLEIIRGAVGSRDKLLEILVEGVKSPESIQGVRNLVILAKLAGALDPRVLQGVAQAVPEALAAAPANQPVSIGSILRQLWSEDTWRGLAALVALLQSLGKALRPTAPR